MRHEIIYPKKVFSGQHTQTGLGRKSCKKETGCALLSLIWLNKHYQIVIMECTTPNA